MQFCVTKAACKANVDSQEFSEALVGKSPSCDQDEIG